MEVVHRKYYRDRWMVVMMNVGWDYGVMVDDDDDDIGIGFAFRIGGRQLTPHGRQFVCCLTAALATLAEVPSLSFG